MELLQYFKNTNDEAAARCTSSQIRELHRRVSQIKSSEKIGVKYMQEWEERAYELQEARAEGMERGMECGIERGIECGMERGIQALILDNLEEGVARDRIIQKLQKRFSLDEARAAAYFEQFQQA